MIKLHQLKIDGMIHADKLQKEKRFFFSIMNIHGTIRKCFKKALEGIKENA